MGACSDGSDVYDPVRNTGGAKCGFGTIARRQGQTWERHADSSAECRREYGWSQSGMSFGSRCGIGEIHQGKAKGLRPAYPTRKGVLTSIGNRSASSKGNKPIKTVDYDDKYINDTTKLTSCPTPLNGSTSRLTCVGDGFHGTKTGYGCGMGDDTAPEGLLNFCKRSDDHFKDSNILKCCLGEKGSVRTNGKTEAGHQYCPRDFCRTNIKFSKVDADEMTKCEADEEKGTDEKV